MRSNHTRTAFACLLIQFLYIALLSGCMLASDAMEGLVSQGVLDAVALVGIFLVLLLPFVCFVTDITSFVFQIFAIKNKESKVWNTLMMVVTVILTIMAILFTHRLLRNMFYG